MKATGNGSGSKMKRYLFILIGMIVVYFGITYFTSKKQVNEMQLMEHYDANTTVDTIYNNCMTAMVTKWGEPVDGRLLQLLVDVDANGKTQQIAIQTLDIGTNSLYYITVEPKTEGGYDANLYKQTVHAEDAANFKDHEPLYEANNFMKEFFKQQPKTSYSFQHYNVSKVSANQKFEGAKVIGDSTDAKAYYLYNLYEKDADGNVVGMTPYLTPVK